MVNQAINGASGQMQLFLMVCLTLCAFAGNSLLNRLGVNGFGMDPMSFAAVRTAAGAATLAALVLLRGGALPLTGRRRAAGAVSLAVYMLGFSWAYISLDAGVGALILFAVVQMVMFGFAVLTRQNVPVLRWVGAGIAMSGLIYLLWPTGEVRISLPGAASMIVAGAAWGVYTLTGQRETAPLAATAANFVVALPLVLLGLFAVPLAGISIAGVLTAIAAGAITSGLGYAFWYRVLPQLATTVAAVAQLCVPVIALVAGLILLGEPVTAKIVIACTLVLGGIAVSLVKARPASQ